MINGIARFALIFGSIILLTGSIFASAQSVPDLPPLDPEAYIGAPSKTSPVSPREEIPTAEPIVDSSIPYAEPIEEPAPKQKIQPRPAISSNGADIRLPVQNSAPVDQNKTQVAILGYHNFSEVKPPTDMRIRTSLFRKQMEALKNSGTPIISMRDFLEWKTGNRNLPANCVMITIDDGWKSVYTDAYPVLKEMGIPFTIFPYTQFLTGLGASLSVREVKEMVAHGATIGSHSTSHLYPSVWKKIQKKGAVDYTATLDKEIRDSRIWLQNTFSVPIECYCYPGGYNTPEMVAKLAEYGYTAGFTVIGQKVQHHLDNMTLPRYMVYGRYPNTFIKAVTFSPSVDAGTQLPSSHSQGTSSTSAEELRTTLPPPAQTVFPLANSIIPRSTPTISITLPKEQGLYPNDMEMRVAGFGRVPAQYKPEASILAWTPNRALRTNPITVYVTWKTGEGKGVLHSATWQFIVREPDENVIPLGVVK